MNSKEEKDAIKMYADSAAFYHDYRTKINPSGWFFNEYLEMPTMLKLIGNVSGKKVLDYGCGTGIYSKILSKKGAKVKGFDISDEMLNIAKKENPNIEFKKGSGYSIPYKEKFDIIVAPLVVHYMNDWNKMFKELSRVLNKGGIFLFSNDNPFFESSKSIVIKGKKYKALGLTDYFKEGLQIATWTNPQNKKEIKVTTYHKTLGTIIKVMIKNGFEIIDYEDCYPDKKSKKLFPKEYELYSKVPKFCVWKLRKK